MIMTQLGKAEDEIFKVRQQKEIQFKAREKAKRQRTEEMDRRRRPDWSLLRDTQFEPTPLGQSKTILNPRQEAYQIRKAGMHSQAEAKLQTVDSKKALESMLDKPESNERRGVKRPREEEDDDEEEVHDEVRLWEDGFKDRYYESKFDVAPKNFEFRNSVALHYVRGLCWVLRYYYQGCASWKWYFPYHYAPFASDFINISGLSTEFEAGTKPFEPLQQLMGVFPAASSKHVPAPWAKLMSDPDSSIIDFYPEDFKIDLNGKKFAWQGVALLPFVDEKRLFKAVEPYYKDLTPAEIKRNIRGEDVLFLSIKTNGYNIAQGLYKENVDKQIETPINFEGMGGTILLTDDCISVNGTLNSPIRGLKPIYGNKVCSVEFRDPQYPDGYVFLAKKLKGAKLPPRVLKPQDLNEESHRSWRPQIGMAPSTTRASLGASGHRMVNHYVPQPQAQRPYRNSNSSSPQTYGGNNYSNTYTSGNYQRGKIILLN
ncbi:hypothetical protein AMK59_5284 [Oryctes borbonicus]|uniref:Xrn1 helical domain-containing protein n=1 Tax=Oryctes borbonicus TaxID=1629725 RepID=A0A0T6B343_9SCAR|nr:hypothetical protein AMK59_5284 [Oryctes borbonicus]